MRIVGKKTERKTNISPFPADMHTYKLTFVSFFYVFFFNLPLSTLCILRVPPPVQLSLIHPPHPPGTCNVRYPNPCIIINQRSVHLVEAVAIAMAISPMPVVKTALSVPLHVQSPLLPVPRAVSVQVAIAVCCDSCSVMTMPSVKTALTVPLHVKSSMPVIR